MLYDKEHSFCRICRSKKANFIGFIRPYVDYHEFAVYDCTDCGCRFVWRDGDVFEEMHASQDLPYSSHEKIAEKVKKYYDTNQIRSLRRYLSRKAKFEFVINNISTVDKNVKIFELGCSLGYLTAYFIRAGYNVLAADISETAVKKARSYFGDYFIVLDENFNDEYRNYFDCVCYLGTIGCVEDPISFTLKALSVLKPGGKLLFNAPNIRATQGINGTWGNFTPPPDLITLFDESFWSRFEKFAEVKIRYDPYDHRRNAVRHFRKLINRWDFSTKGKFFHEINVEGNSKKKFTFRKLMSKIGVAVLYYLSRCNLICHYANEFGMFVKFTKR